MKINHKRISIASELQKDFQQSYKNYIEKKFNIPVDDDTLPNRRQNILIDFLSFKSLFKAYKDSSKDLQTSDMSLPGLEINDEKVFWIAMTQRFCTFEKTRETTISKIYNSFVLSQFRNEIPRIFIKDFANTFNCSDKIN